MTQVLQETELNNLVPKGQDQRMIIESVSQELLQRGGESLVNIPIEIPESSGILQDITNTVWQSGLQGKPAQGSKSNKRWKRYKGKEHSEKAATVQLVHGWI